MAVGGDRNYMERTSPLEDILTHWGIKAVANWETIQENIAKITPADGPTLVLKELGPDSEATRQRLHFEYEILHHVEQSGLSVAVPLLSKQGVPYVSTSENLYRLSHWLPNQPAMVQTNEERIRLYQNYGFAIGRFHQALAGFQDSHSLSQTWQTTLHKRVIEEAVPVVIANLDQTRLSSFQALWAELESPMTAAYANLPLQPIIWDCHPGNVAVNGFEVSGFIDCDHIAIAPRIFDLADFLVHLLKWEVDDEQKAALWLAHFHHVTLGYQSTPRLSEQERAALFYAMLGLPLIFMDFFFQNGLPELTKVEFNTFVWLARHQAEIMAQLVNQSVKPSLRQPKPTKANQGVD